MKMQAIRRRLNFIVFRKHVWVDLNGNYGPTIRGSTHSMRLIRIKHHSPGFVFGGHRYHKRLYKVRGLPNDWMHIAANSDFEPIEKYPGVWDVFDKDAGGRHHDLYGKKWRAWLACYRAAVDRDNIQY